MTTATPFVIPVCCGGLLACALLASQPAWSEGQDGPPGGNVPAVKALVGRLDLQHYKATIKGLTRFGDRWQGTQRNRDAVDWIETEVRSYGCADVERLRFVADPAPLRRSGGIAGSRAIASGEVVTGVGGSRLRGRVGPQQANEDPAAQSDAALRALNAGPATPGPSDDVYCTKVGAGHPDEMYIVGAHLDGRGFGEAADDDGSGTALVMELARVLSDPAVVTERSIRFVLWNNEENGLAGSRAYVRERAPLQGRENPPGSRRYPEPTWLGMIQHDMVLWDHGMPDAAGAVSPAQRREADIDIEFQSTAGRADQAMKLAFVLREANDRYATDYPAAVSPHMSNTDSTPFMDLVAAVSVRENQRGAQIGAGWNPHYHQATDRFSSYSDQDFLLGLNAAQTTLGAVAELAGATLKK